MLQARPNPRFEPISTTRKPGKCLARYSVVPSSEAFLHDQDFVFSNALQGIEQVRQVAGQVFATVPRRNHDADAALGDSRAVVRRPLARDERYYVRAKQQQGQQRQ